MVGMDVLSMCQRIGHWEQFLFDRHVENAVRRWESSHGHQPTGLFTEQYAIELGD
jgi:hypothetical protein